MKANSRSCEKDRQTLFIAASPSPYLIRMNVKGANPAK
jgi:hypothetical protein